MDFMHNTPNLRCPAMKRENLTSLCVLMLAFFLGGCATPAPPHAAYPVVYNILVTNTQVHADTNPPNLNMSSTQDVAVVSGQLLYYQVVSPVDVTVYFYGVEGQGERVFLGQMEGRTFTSSVMPNTNTLEFVFVATQPDGSAAVKFTLSDQPTAPAAAP
jgi:hypothetical protein